MKKRKFDALVVGGGAAGLYTALCLSEDSSHNWQIGLITKDDLSLSASDWAQGGIAAVMDADDSAFLHSTDTIHAGAGLCEARAVEVLVSSAKQQIEKLVALGVDFDRHGSHLAMTLEAAHSRRRVLHAADATGRALVSTLAARVLDRPNIHVLSKTLVLDLQLHKGRCTGISCICLDRVLAVQLEYLVAPVIVLATGGGAQVFSQTTNPPSSTGDGVAIAWRAGASVRDMEFVQFHPTALAVTGAPRFLISEAVRGEGAHLIDTKGDRFAFAYDPKGELAPRDVVSRAIFNHLQKSGEHTVFLDLSPIAPETIARRFPNIIRICQQWQIDLFSTPIPVTPAAHYCMGGIVTNSYGATSIPGLYAVGETASTGVHGANRLASNSLLECFVFGERLAKFVSDRRLAIASQENGKWELEHLDGATSNHPKSMEDIHAAEVRIKAIKTALRDLAWQAVGICRTGKDMEVALAQIQAWQQELPDLARGTTHRLWVETRNLTDFAYLLVRSALFRTESRGAHYRLDYPDTDPNWQVHTVVQSNEISTQPLGTPED